MRRLFAGVLLLVGICETLSGAPEAADEGGGSRITFLSHRSGNNLLYVMKPDGTGIKAIFGGAMADVPMLVEGTTIYREPHWSRQSPNRKYFASWASDQGSPYERYQGSVRYMLYAGGIEAAWRRVVNADCDENFAWSPDSRFLAFAILFGGHDGGGFLRSSLRSTQIGSCGLDGSQQVIVLEQPGILVVLDWSPDGKRLLLGRRRFDAAPPEPGDILQFELADALTDRSRSPALARSGWAAMQSPRFLKLLLGGTRHRDLSMARYSPDGKSIAVEFADRDKMYAPNELGDNEVERSNGMRYLGKLAVFEIARGRFTTIIDDSEGLRGPICWSPDGNEILFSRYLPKGDDREKLAKQKEHGLAIWAIDKDGHGARMMTTGWSPDWR